MCLVEECVRFSGYEEVGMIMDDTVDLFDHIEMDLLQSGKRINAIDQSLVFRGVKLGEEWSRCSGVGFEEIMEVSDLLFSFNDGMDSRGREDMEIVRHEEGVRQRGWP